MRQKPKAAKLVIAAKDGRRVLLVRRRRDGLWTFPGGKRNGGSESLKECLSREIEEELDAKAKIGDLVFVSEDVYAGRSKDDDKRHELTLIFAGEISEETTEGERVLSPESDKNFRWLPLGELAGANLLPAVRNAIQSDRYPRKALRSPVFPVPRRQRTG